MKALSSLSETDTENRILSFFRNRNFEKSRRFSPGEYSPRHLAEFLTELRAPQLQYNTVHIAGTNGKGSLTHYLSRLLSACGYKTAAYLSPHLLHLHERILFNGREISEDDLNRIWQQIQGPHLHQLSFFDALTAMAFLYFKEKNVDYAVIETGLGGRLDSTNNLTPSVVIITPVGLDHTEFLGNSIEKIATEKAGIIKKPATVFTYNQHAEALQVIEEKCHETGCSLTVIDTSECESFTEMNMKAARTVAASINEKAANIKIDTGLPGRFELLRVDPTVIFDSAHNNDAVKGLLQAVKAYSDRNHIQQITFIYNTLKEKITPDINLLIQNMIPGISYRLLRLNLPDERFNRAAADEPGISIDRLKNYTGLTGLDLTVIFGSNYLYGPVLKALAE